MEPAASEFAYRPAARSDKAAVLAITPDIFNGIDYIDWQFNMLVDSPTYCPWVCESRATGQILAFAYGFASDADNGGEVVSMAGGRTRSEHRSAGLNAAIAARIIRQVTERRPGQPARLPAAILGVHCQPHYLIDRFACWQGDGGSGSGGFVINGRVVMEHSCLAFDLTPAARCRLAPAAAASAADTAIALEQSPETLITAEPPASLAGVGLGPGQAFVLLREAAYACPDTLARLRHWTRSALVSRGGGGGGGGGGGDPHLTGVSFANWYTCLLGVNLVLNVYATCESAAAGHIAEQLRRFLVAGDSDGVAADAVVGVSAYFPMRLCVNDILSRVHLTRWLPQSGSGDSALPLCNRPSVFCAMRVTRSDLADRRGSRAALKAGL